MWRDTQPGHICILVDPELRSLIPGFLQHRTQEIALLRQALQRSDFDFIKTLAHSIKGVGGGYGFADLFEIAARIELAATHQDSHDSTQGIQDLSSYFERVEITYE
jgi:HPt (histidine-containing phosphotransfer) domain-containing protein